MTLEKAISFVIDKEGIEIIGETRFVNYLNDLLAFDKPAVKRIVVTMVSGGYTEKLKHSLATQNYELDINDAKSKLVNNEGFQANLVEYVLNCLLYATKKTTQAPVMPLGLMKATTSASAPISPENNTSIDTIEQGLSTRDPLFDKCAQWVVTNDNVTASALQRRFQIGYNRANRILDQMERAGIVGPHLGSKPRQVLVSASALDEHLRGASLFPSSIRDKDPFFEEAARFVAMGNTASIASLQRRYEIGYSRACGLMDQLERAGIVGPANGSKPRDVLASPMDLDDYFDGKKPITPKQVRTPLSRQGQASKAEPQKSTPKRNKLSLYDKVQNIVLFIVLIIIIIALFFAN